MKPLFFLMVALALAGAPAHAQGSDSDQARRMVERGQILPLAQALNRLAARQPGQVIGVKLRTTGPRPIYVVDLVTPAGRLIEVDVDAVNGRILALDRNRRGGDTAAGRGGRDDGGRGGRDGDDDDDDDDDDDGGDDDDDGGDDDDDSGDDG